MDKHDVGIGIGGGPVLDVGVDADIFQGVGVADAGGNVLQEVSTDWSSTIARPVACASGEFLAARARILRLGNLDGVDLVLGLQGIALAWRCCQTHVEVRRPRQDDAQDVPGDPARLLFLGHAEAVLKWDEFSHERGLLWAASPNRRPRQSASPRRADGVADILGHRFGGQRFKGKTN